MTLLYVVITFMKTFTIYSYAFECGFIVVTAEGTWNDFENWNDKNEEKGELNIDPTQFPWTGLGPHNLILMTGSRTKQ